MNEYTNANLGLLLKRLVQSGNITTKELALRLGVSRTSIFYWINDLHAPCAKNAVLILRVIASEGNALNSSDLDWLGALQTRLFAFEEEKRNEILRLFVFACDLFE